MSQTLEPLEPFGTRGTDFLMSVALAETAVIALNGRLDQTGCVPWRTIEAVLTETD